MKTLDLFKILGVLIIISFLSSCEYEFIELPDNIVPPPPDTTDSVNIISFSQEIAPIFTNDGCISCHNGSFKFDLGPANAYNSIISNNLVVAEDPSNSKIYTYPHPITGAHHKYSTVAEADSIAKWIYQGALNN
jgi:hypothetical protein